MRGYRTTSRKRGAARKGPALLVGACTLVLTVGVCGFPLPEIVDRFRIDKGIEAGRDADEVIHDLSREANALSATVPGRIRKAWSGLREGLPRVDNLLILRNLVLAHADVAGVRVSRCVLGEPRFLGPCIPGGAGPESMARAELELDGLADPDRLILFLGLLEGTRFAFQVERITLGARAQESSGDNGSGEESTFRISLRTGFRAPAQVFDVTGR